MYTYLIPHGMIHQLLSYQASLLPLTDQAPTYTVYSIYIHSIYSIYIHTSLILASVDNRLVYEHTLYIVQYNHKYTSNDCLTCDESKVLLYYYILSVFAKLQ
jgi:hypothetical protein